MGNCCVALSEEQKESKKKNATIERELQAERRRIKEEVKLLLLGAGESGKSTIFKQMKVISLHGGFTPEDLIFYSTIVFGNCITQMKVIVGAAAKLGISLESQEANDAAQRITAIPSEGEAWTQDVGKDIKLLWADGGIQRTYQLRDREYQLNDSANYFFDEIERINASDYSPITQDVLRARIRSTGIEEAKFTFDNMEFTMVDVGGQRSERRKWIHCFDTVTAVLFTVALSEYDQTLREDPNQNRSKESLMLFDEICNSPWFRETAFILFLNKIDLFEEKLKHSPLSATFKEYTGGSDVKAAQNFMKQKFEAINQSPHKIYIHFTCAVNTKNIEIVFKAVRDTIMQEVIDVLF
eukprot:TRINITY_DN13657_c0_g1_i1.p1 TRINITY_DN13657_c0_g1~~TRINITY_DN13657_c0_g1_i1.p1  ORF type:complete len:354 (-),score=75.24 TRINITY_DN13657_c0_g1_i1:52-1113(-)